MRSCPGGTAAVASPLTQQQRLELLARPEPSAHRVFARSRQIAQCLIALIGDRDTYELPGARRSSQQQRIAPISLDPIPGPGEAFVTATCDRYLQCSYLLGSSHPFVQVRFCGPSIRSSNA